MEVIYICRITDFQASGNQIDIPKNVAIDFFNVSENNINEGINTGINICHISNLQSFTIIELQPATNMRWSTKLNTFLSDNNDPLTSGCLLVFEKLMRSYCVHTIKTSDSKFATLVDLFEEKERHLLLSATIRKSKKVSSFDLPLQQIYYGAPGTGKSNTIKELIDDRGEICFRTTFHPDSDYSTFVGCYKPRSNKKNMLEGNGYSLAQLLSRFFDSYDNKYQSAKKARYLYESLVNTMDIRRLGMSADDVSNKLKDQGFQGCAYTTEATCMYNIYDWLKADGYIVENKISYEFTPQAFTLAYVEAWRQHKNNKPVYLVIEEINRGNCAQIFGDLFQLLDRDDDGYSRYDIIPDTDLCEYIAEQGLEITGVTNSKGEDVSSKIARGEIMKLPNNLYIWATMNTSDQSLFPIDSAFKRRWDWKYIKISNAFKKDEATGEYLKDSDGKKIPLGWKIGNLDVEWWQFLQKINEIIASMTSSADKQLGYFFCKAKNGIIDEETFVSKVIFYLWNDVFKDYGFEDASLFQYKDEKGEPKDLTFPDFYDEDSKNVNTVRLNEFIENVMNWKKTEEEHR